MDAATLLAEHTQALDAVLLRLRALEQEQQALFQQRLRLEGAVEALRTLQETCATRDALRAVADAGRVPVDARGG